MPDRSNLVYRYDGTFPGFLCCVAECFRDKRLPQGIELFDEPQATLFPVKEIETEPKLADRVERSIPSKISPEAYRMVREGFLTNMEEKELCLTRFLLLGYKYGPRVTKLSTNPDVHILNKALLFLKNEAHFHVEFLRFSDCGEFLVSEITPKNMVLPLIVGHFCDRFPAENFVIYDRPHQTGFLSKASAREAPIREFFHADSLVLPAPDEEERKFRSLWKLFYKTIAIEGRINPALRRSMCPMRYWPNMTEFQDKPERKGT